MKKILSFMAGVIVSLLFVGNASAQTLELPYGEFYTDGESPSLGTAIVEIPDDLTLQTDEKYTSGGDVTLDYWYEHDGGKVLDGYDYGLYLTVFVPTVENIESPFEATVTLTLPSKFDQNDFVIKNNGKEVEVTRNKDGSITFVALIGIDYQGDGTIDANIFNGFIFLKDAGNAGTGTGTTTGTTTDDKTIATDSSSKVETTISVTNALPEGSALSVKEVTISSELKTSETNLKKVFDISVLDTAGAVVEVKDNKMTITMNLDEDLKKFNKYEVVYIKDGKVAERIPATVKDGKISFTTTHLSEYGIVAYNETKNTEKNPNTLDNVALFVTLGSVSLAGLLGAGLYLKKKTN